MYNIIHGIALYNPLKYYICADFKKSNKLMKSVFVVISFLIVMSTTHAQRGYELGGWIGSAFYFGDLNPNFNLLKPGLAGGIQGRVNFNNRISLKLSANVARVRGTDEVASTSFEKKRNLNFYSNIYDLTPMLEFNFFPYIHGSRDSYFTPYVGFGFSVFHYAPKTKLNGVVYNLRDFNTEGSEASPNLSVSTGWTAAFGLKWDINYKYSINIEFSARYLATDYLDDVSGTYPDLDYLKLEKGEIAVQLSDRSGIEGFASEGRQRGDSTKNDSYNFFGISIMRYFGKVACPTVSKIR